MPVEVLFPRDPGLANNAGNLNFETRFAGRASPSFAHVLLSTTDRLHYAAHYPVETISPAGTSTGSNARQYQGINFTMLRLDNGTETVDNTFNDVIQSAIIADSGSGTRLLICGFGSSTNPRIAYRDLTTDTTPWTVQTTATYAQFWMIEKGGADLYAVTDAGVAILGEYRVSKCPAGNNPTLAASWGNGLEVGTPEWRINSLAAIGDSVVAGKPDGLYYYNDQTKRFENVLPFLAYAPHALNGKGMRAVPNGVLYPTNDGHLYFFDGVSVKDVSPDTGHLPRDAGYARTSALAPIADEVYAIRESWQNTTQQLGLKVITYIAGTFADVTASVTDGSLATGADLTNLGGAANDRIYVGADMPLEAIAVRVTRNVNAVANYFDPPYYSNGTTGVTGPFTTSFTAFTGIRDGSLLSVASTSLVNTGYPPAASNSVISWTDINSFDLSTSTALQFGGSIGTLTKYWYALKLHSVSALTSSTTIDEVEVVPSRQGLPVTSTKDFTHRWRAGGLTEILVAKVTGTNTYQWHSVYHVDTGGGVWSAAWHSGRPGQAAGAQNMGQQLVLWGRYTRAVVMESPLRDPGRTTAPVLAQPSTTKPGPILDLAPGGTWLLSQDPSNQLARKRVKAFSISGDFIQSADQTRIHVQMDETDIVTAVSVFGGPWRVEVDGLDLEGQRMQAWLEFIQSSTNKMRAPEFNYIAVEYDYTSSEQEWMPLWKDQQTPEVT